MTKAQMDRAAEIAEWAWIWAGENDVQAEAYKADVARARCGGSRTMMSPRMHRALLRLDDLLAEEAPMLRDIQRELRRSGCVNERVRLGLDALARLTREQASVNRELEEAWLLEDARLRRERAKARERLLRSWESWPLPETST